MRLTVTEGFTCRSRPRRHRQGGHPGSRKPYFRRGSHREGHPCCSSISGCQPPIECKGTTPAGPLRQTYSQEGPSNMSPRNDRSTSQPSASLNPDGPDTFPSSRRIVHGSTQSVRRPGGTHHSVQLPQICNREEQNGPRTSGIKGSAASFRAFYTGSGCQYWGRRRYGPAQQAFRLA
jgi:hypothetical protein